MKRLLVSSALVLSMALFAWPATMTAQSRRGSGGGGGQATSRGGGGAAAVPRGGPSGPSGAAVRPPAPPSGGGRQTASAPPPTYGGGRSRDGRPASGQATTYRGGGVVYVPRYTTPYYGYYPYGYGAFGLGYFYYDPFWWEAPYGGGYYGYGYGYGYDRNGYSDYGALKLQVKPRDAEVYVDGYYVGQVRDFDGLFHHLDLESGPHRIEVRMAGYEPLVFEVKMLGGQTINYRGELRPLQKER
jgi:hypothetical protein